MRRNKGLRPHRVSVVALVLGISASFVLSLLANGSVGSSDRILLRQDAAQGSLLLSSLLGQTPAPVGQLADNLSPAEISSWQAIAGPVATKNQYSTLAVLRQVGNRFEVTAAVGSLHRQLGTAADAPIISGLKGGRSPYFAVSAQRGKRWLGTFVRSPSDPNYIIYSESAVSDKPISLASLPGQPFSGVVAGVYVGQEAPKDLAYNTAAHLPTAGERAVGVISGSGLLNPSPTRLSSRAGSLSAPGRFLLVVWPTGHLSGDASAALPLVLLVGGLVATLAVAALLELSERRRDRVVQTLSELEERNVALDAALVSQQRADARFSAMVRSSSDLTTVVSASGEILYQSPSASTTLGVDPATLVDKSYPALMQPDERPLWESIVARVEQQPWTEVAAEWHLRDNEGAYVFVDTRVTNLLDDPAVSGIVLNGRDVTERKRLEDELRHQAFHDSLTGLANRALFEDRLENALARISRTQDTLGVLFLDLDDFKAVNDGRGHNVGDELLKAVGVRLQETLRAGDTFARIGGDEFAVLVEGPDNSGGVETAERILEALRPPIILSTGEASVRASIGVVNTNGLRSAQELLRDADIAMYAAKNAGKARIEIFHSGLHDDVINRLQLEVDLGRALENQEILAYYQPLVDLPTEQIVGMEALMRWMHPHRGLVMPGEFIPIAENTGLIVPLGKWLLRRACSDVTNIHEKTGRPDLQLSVNLSARQLDDPELVDDVQAALTDSGLAPHLLTLEITESVFMANPERSLAVLERLRALGAKLSIDDFGTGYSSLGYLQRLPVDELKIDRSFIVAAEDSSESRSLVRTIVDLAQEFGLRTVAEGIETNGQLHSARDAGCELAQGYLFAKPTDVHQLLQTLISSAARPHTDPVRAVSPAHELSAG